MNIDIFIGTFISALCFSAAHCLGSLNEEYEDLESIGCGIAVTLGFLTALSTIHGMHNDQVFHTHNDKLVDLVFKKIIDQLVDHSLSQETIGEMINEEINTFEQDDSNLHPFDHTNFDVEVIMDKLLERLDQIPQVAQPTTPNLRLETLCDMRASSNNANSKLKSSPTSVSQIVDEASDPNSHKRPDTSGL